MITLRHISRIISSQKSSHIFLKQRPQLNRIKFQFKSSQVSQSNVDSKEPCQNIEPDEENALSLKDNVLESVSNERSESEMSSNVKTMRNPFWSIENDYKDHDPNDDVPHFIDDIVPSPDASFNLAAYAKTLPTIQKLIELGVDMTIVEQKPNQAKFLVRLNFERDVQPYLEFLRDVGVPPEDMAHILSRSPELLQDDLENLRIKVNYLESKKFSDIQIARIVSKNPVFLTFSTKAIDQRLGFLQETFHLSGKEVRDVLTRLPRIATHRHKLLLENIFCIKEVMGFSKEDMKEMILLKTKIFLINYARLDACFDVLHNVMGLSHKTVMKHPGAFYTRVFILKQRHKYLVHLGRAQYDPKKPCYISLKDFASTNDDVFCRKFAKTSVAEFNEFLKTL